MSGFDDPFLSDALQPVADAVPEPLAVRPPSLHFPGGPNRALGGVTPSGIRRPVPRLAVGPAAEKTAVPETAIAPPAVEPEPTPCDPLPFEGLTSSFATADPMNAGEYLCVIPADVSPTGGLSLGSEMRGSLHAEVRQWVDNLRKRNTTAAGQLRSFSPRDDAIDQLANRLIDQASKSRTGVWTAALPTGRQLALVRQDVFKAVGLDQLVRFIHHQAIKVAMVNGDAYSQAALQAYEVGHPEMSAAGAR